MIGVTSITNERVQTLNLITPMRRSGAVLWPPKYQVFIMYQQAGNMCGNHYIQLGALISLKNSEAVW